MIAFTAGIILLLCSTLYGPIENLRPQDEPILQTAKTRHVRGVREKIHVVDFIAAEVKRYRREDYRGLNDGVIASLDCDRATHLGSERSEGSVRSPTEDDATNSRAAFAGLLQQLLLNHQDEGAMSFERSFLVSSVVDRILVLPNHRALFCPIPGSASSSLTQFAENTENAVPGQLPKLADFSIRDREKLLRDSSIFRYVFVRHPFSRSASTFAKGVQSGDLDSDSYRAFMGLVRGHNLTSREREIQKLSLLFYLTFVSKQRRENLPEIFIPQVHLCGIGTIDYTLIGRLESFENDSLRLRQALGTTLVIDNTNNASVLEIPAANMIFRSQKHRAKAIKMYATDLDVLHYKPKTPQWYP